MEFNATFLISAISFLVFVYLMNKIFYAPLTNIIDERAKLIDDTLKSAKNSNDKALELLQERENELNNATENGKKIVAQSVEIAVSQAQQLIQNAKNNFTSEVAIKKTELQNESDLVSAQLDYTVTNLAEEISSKILGYKTKISG